MTERVGKGVGMGHRYSLGAPTGLSQEHNQCLVTDTSAAGSSSRPAARDVRDDPSRAPREAHTRLGFCTPARASPPRPRPQDLLRRAGPVNRGAVRGRVQLDGRRLLLGHFGPRKGAPNSEGGPSSFLPLSCPAPASRGQVRAASPDAAFGGRALRGPVRAKEPVAVWGNPRPTCSMHREPKGFPAGAAQQPGIPSRSPSVNRSPGARTTTLLQPQPGKVRRRHCRVPSGSAQQSQRGTGGRGRAGGRAGDRGSLAPPIPGGCVFHTPTWARPYCPSQPMRERLGGR